MMKRAVVIIAAVVAIVTCADIARNGPARDIRYPGIKIRICQKDRHRYEVTEDAPLFYARFAVMEYPEYLVNYAEHRQLAVEVARTIAAYFGSTNDIRIVHWQQPKPADTNDISQVLSAMLKGEYVTDEIVPRGKREGQ